MNKTVRNGGLSVLILFTAMAGCGGGNTGSSALSNPGTIYFASEDFLMAMNADGSNTRRISARTGANISGRNLSPDGRRMVYQGSRIPPCNGGFGCSNPTEIPFIAISNVDGSGVRNLLDDTISAGEISWTPDGKSIMLAFNSRQSSDHGIALLDPDTGKITPITQPQSKFDGNPTFSQDGHKIVFTSNRLSSDSDLFIMNSDGSGLKRILQREGYELDPALSPDGQQVVFIIDSPGLPHDLYVLNLKTGLVRQLMLITSAGQGNHPAWSPDGRFIAFHTFGDNAGVFTVRPDGTDLKRISSGRNADWRR